MKRRSIAIAGTALLLTTLGVPAAAQGPTLEVIADGLNVPRGVSIADDGSIYVAEAGAAGDDCLETNLGDVQGGFCYGPTGAIVRIADGSVERVIEGLPSTLAGPDMGGVSDVAVAADGSIYLVMNLGADPAVRADFPEELAFAGHLVKADADGNLEPVADVAAFETEANPDAAFDGPVDSNPYGIAMVDGGVAVADAGGNSVVRVADDGSVSLIAVLPLTLNEFPAEALAAMGPPPAAQEETDPVADGSAPEGEGAPAEGEAGAPAEGEAPPPGAMVEIPVQAVPTSVAVGPDGALYVGELTGGPFPVGGAAVWRIAEGEEPTRYATGFSAIMDIDFGPDGTLYVAELVHGGLMSVFAGGQPPIGAVMSVAPGGGEPTMVHSGPELMAPGGLAVDDEGAIYVSTGTVMEPGAGAVVRITP